MKAGKYYPMIVAGLLLAASPLFSQTNDSRMAPAMPGDHFSLEGALDIFKQSANPEAFERKLNEEGNDVNNLDLNRDGQIDYVRVINKRDGDAQVFILQAVLGEDDYQDVAVLELEKNGPDRAVIQAVGDRDLYGEERIVEPVEDAEDLSAGYYDRTRARGPHAGFAEELPLRVVVNVWAWPSVRFVYGPAYRPWVSPWSWRHRPVWYRPCRPAYYNVYHPRRVHYHRYYVAAPSHRVVHAHRVYAPVRVTSVHHRHPARHTPPAHHHRGRRVHHRHH